MQIPSVQTFCTVFKAARRAARAAATARTPPLPLALPLRLRQRRSAGAKNYETRRPPDKQQSPGFIRAGGVHAPAADIVRGRAEPVKPVCDHRATASVKLPGECTREDGLDRTCPRVPEMAAIGSMGTSGPGSHHGNLIISQKRSCGEQTHGAEDLRLSWRESGTNDDASQDSRPRRVCRRSFASLAPLDQGGSTAPPPLCRVPLAN